ncbi:hypothetical protein HMPREF9445_02101 [Bacteroides clarus YIT 12056]|uniref:Uncharacterized protein n=1 Tax=Bacteroides clarus YIT 12056 TaxID=762984 RepID=A0ABP2KRM1_9BACE|nr:hypothetical protein HMPREF9445_02101 [Bacteroides clarus YIT 12056]
MYSIYIRKTSYLWDLTSIPQRPHIFLFKTENHSNCKMFSMGIT